MRDIVSCLSESSLIVSNPSAAASACTSFSHNAFISPSFTPSVKNAISSLYRTVLSSQKRLLITVTWLRTHAGHALTIKFIPNGAGSNLPASFKLNMSSRFFRKKKGSRPIESASLSGLRIEVFWDLSNARFPTGPEPTDCFYVAVAIDSEIGLFLGDMSQDANFRKSKFELTDGGKFSLISRREYCSGNTVYTTRARFSAGSPVHDIMVRFVGEDQAMKQSALLVYVDKKLMMRSKRLIWNFRGNQTMFIDGMLVDLMWDLHGWFDNNGPGSGNAVFMFRTRSGLDSRLWLEENLLPQQNEEKNKSGEFSLMIYASK